MSGWLGVGEGLGRPEIGWFEVEAGGCSSLGLMVISEGEVEGSAEPGYAPGWVALAEVESSVRATAICGATREKRNVPHPDPCSCVDVRIELGRDDIPSGLMVELLG